MYFHDSVALANLASQVRDISLKQTQMDELTNIDEKKTSKIMITKYHFH